MNFGDDILERLDAFLFTGENHFLDLAAMKSTMERGGKYFRRCHRAAQSTTGVDMPVPDELATIATDYPRLKHHFTIPFKEFVKYFGDDFLFLLASFSTKSQEYKTFRQRLAMELHGAILRC